MVPFEAQYCSLHSLVKEDCSTLGHFEYYRDDNAFAKEVGFSSRIMGTSHNKIVIPTGAQRSGGTCFGFFLGSHTHSKARELDFENPPCHELGCPISRSVHSILNLPQASRLLGFTNLARKADDDFGSGGH